VKLELAEVRQVVAQRLVACSATAASMELKFAHWAQVLLQVVLLQLPVSVLKTASKVAPLFLAPGLVQVQAAARPQGQRPSVPKKASKAELLLVALELVQVQVPVRPQGQ